MQNQFKNNLYYERMQAAAGDKSKILDHMQPRGEVLDVGAGSGTISALIAARYPEAVITMLEADASACRRLCQMGKDTAGGNSGRFRLVQNDFFQYVPYAPQYNTILFSAVIHEIMSYTEYGGCRCNPMILPHILAAANSILKPGGRIIIRDGVLPEKTVENTWLGVTFRTDTPRSRMLEMLAERYAAETGMEVHRDAAHPHTIYGACDDITNLLYTITWGEASFPREVQERTAYFSLSDWAHLERLLLRRSGLHIIEMQSYLQPGYADNLLPYLSVTADGADNTKAFPKGLPDSNCLVVLEKT